MFVDGINNVDGFPLYQAPLGGHDAQVQIAAPRLVAFANPYDGQGNTNYDEFHCVYELTGGTNTMGDGLLIVRGANNGWWSFGTYKQDTRSVLNQSTGVLFPYVTPYAGAANQAGIHVIMEASSSSPAITHAYARDPRRYDETIEENTIMSGTNFIADGSSHFGSTSPIYLSSGKSILEWFDADVTMLGPSMKLQIGTTTSTDPISELIYLPTFSWTFQDQSLLSNRQLIDIERTGLLDYYGQAGDDGLHPNFHGAGTLSMTGYINSLNTTPTNYLYPTLDAVTAKLILEPGSNLVLPIDISDQITYPGIFDAVYTDITSKYGTTIENSSQSKNGTMSVAGVINLYESIFHTYAPDRGAGNLSDIVMTLNNASGATLPVYPNDNFIYNCLFKEEGSGSARIYFNDPLNEILVEGGRYYAVGVDGNFKIHTSDNPIPSRPLTIEYADFDGMSLYGIHLSRAFEDVSSGVDYNITLQGNYFENFNRPNSEAVKLEDFIHLFDGSSPDVNIVSNNFSTASSLGTGNYTKCAIHLDNTSAVVDDNAITASSYSYGILQESYNSPFLPTNSLLCSNTISNMNTAGIFTSMWHGYEKHNTISICGIGSEIASLDKPSIIFANYHDNTGPGIMAYGSDSSVTRVEMRGVIHPNNDANNSKGDIPGYNLIKDNGGDAQVVMSKGAVFHIGNEIGTAPTSVVYGQNSFIAESNLLFSTSVVNPQSSIGGLAFFDGGVLNGNYYETGSTAYTPLDWAPQHPNGIDIYDPKFNNIQYNNQGNNVPNISMSLLTGALNPDNFFGTCYGSSERAKGGAQIQTMAYTAITSDSCLHLENLANELSGSGNPQQNQETYDTAKLYLTLCYDQPRSETMFNITDFGNVGRSDDLQRFVEYREFLKSVLYLRADTEWYCRDVLSIMTTMDYFEGHGNYPNGGIAIEKYILEHHRCDNYDSLVFAHRLSGEYNTRYQIWRDSVNVQDSLDEPMDTTIPSIDDIGLSILRGPKEAVHQPRLIAGDQLSDLRITENPFTKNTDVIFTLNDYGLVTFQLFNALGQEVTTNGIGQVLEPGEHTFEIDGSKLAPGTYIARLSYHNGDTKSIMVVKE